MSEKSRLMSGTQNFYRILEQSIEQVIDGRRTLSDVAPKLIILLKNGAKWNRNDLIMSGGMTPCHVICRSKGDHQELLELMIKELGRTLLNVKDDNESTALMYAVSNTNIKCMKSLIANGADVNDIRVLFGAVCNGNVEVVCYLLKQRVTMTSYAPKKYVEVCGHCKTNVLCHYINATELNSDPYVLAVRHNMVDVVRLMDEFGCELHKSSEILSLAICDNSVDVVEYLLCNYKYPLNYGYTVEYINQKSNSGHQTFLLKACETQSVKMVKLLLDLGADPNKNCCVEKCPSVINVAIYKRHVEFIAGLLRVGVNVNTRSCYPNMDIVLPFEAAVYDNHIYAAEMLLVAGCSRGIHILDNICAPKAKIEPEMQKLLKEWNVHKNGVQPLQQRCRMVILNHLCPQADKKTKELPLPPQIIKYLSILELDDILETFKCKPLTTYSYVK